jgi:hypothetical protein
MEVPQRNLYSNYQTPQVSQNCVAGTATFYELDGVGIESRLWQDFSHPSTRALGPTQPPLEGVPVPFHEDKSAGLWCYHPTPSSAEVKERVALYIYSPFGLSLHGLG